MEKKKATAAHMRATQKWERENYFRPSVRFPKALEPRIRAAAGDSLNGFILSAVLEKLERLEQAPAPDPETEQ